MSNTITIKHGGQAPQAGQLANFELGYCTGDGKLYFNANGTIKSFLPNIENGFTLNNNQSINSKLSDGSDYSLIFRSPSNNTWVGGRIDNKPAIGNLYLAVGKGSAGNGEENAYVFRMSKNAANAAGGSSLIYDETSILDGFRINNKAEITTFLSDGATEVSLIKRSNDNIWIGQRAVASQGGVYLGVGTGVDSMGYVYVARGQNYISSTDYSDLSKILDYGFVAKNLFSGTWSVGNTITISNFKDYRYFIVDLYNQANSLLVTRRGNFLRGGVVYAQNGVVFECVRITGTDSGVVTYNEGRDYTATTSGLTANWGGSTAVKDIVNVWGVL
jgi:hypothetical protein